MVGVRRSLRGRSVKFITATPVLWFGIQVTAFIEEKRVGATLRAEFLTVLPDGAPLTNRPEAQNALQRS